MTSPSVEKILRSHSYSYEADVVGRLLLAIEHAQSDDAVDPHAASTGTPTPRASSQSVDSKTVAGRLALPAWQPIETAPKDRECWFWIRPKTAEETYYDTSGRPILLPIDMKAHVEATFVGRWGSLWTADYWQPYVEPLPPPPAADQEQPPGARPEEPPT